MKLSFRIVFFLLLISMAGCSSGAHDDADGRVAAVVNGVEITHREIDFLYRQGGASGASDKQAGEQRRRILADVVRSELLAQKATDMNLDRSPEFMVAMHDARRRVLAGFAEREIGRTVRNVTPQEISKVVADNPSMFSGRRLMVYDEVLVSGVDVPFLNAINALAADGASLDRLLGEVKEKRFPFQRSTRALTSDQIQPAIVSVLSRAMPGRPLVARVENRFSMILMLRASVPVPLEGEAASQAAMQRIGMQQRGVALSKKMGELIDGASITYFGEYAADSSGNGKLTVLPVPDGERTARKLFKRSVLGGTLSFSFMAAVMVLTASMQILRGELWFPCMWPSPKIGGMKSRYDLPYVVPPMQKFAVFLAALIVFFVLGLELFVLWGDFPVWGIAICVVFGLAIGVGASRIFGLSAVRQLSNKLPALPLVLFSLLIFLCLFVTIRVAVS
mgnify:CR=1 FL=1|jgi:EpsD family peptidyl-prolyl cis-trans isomerase